MCTIVEHSLGEVTVRPWQEATLSLTLSAGSRPFVPTWYQVPDDVAPHFVIEDVLIGHSRQFCSGGGVPAGIFADSSRFRRPDVSLVHDVLSVRSRLEMKVTNVTGRERVFRCEVVGRDVEPGQTCGGGTYTVIGLETGMTRSRAGFEIRVNERMIFNVTPTNLYVPDELLDVFQVVQLQAFSANQLSVVPTKMLSPENLRGQAEISLRPCPTAQAGKLLTLLARHSSGGPSYFRGAVLALIGDQT